MSNARSKTVTLSSIVGNAAFKAGIADYLAGRGFPATYETDPAKLGGGRGVQWTYERGRQFAAWCRGAGINPPVTRDKTGVRREALTLANRAFVERAIL